MTSQQFATNPPTWFILTVSALVLYILWQVIKEGLQSKDFDEKDIY